MFGENLKYLRAKHNMEQSELAEKLGRKSSSSISEWEKGKYTPKMKVLNEIAKVFKVSIEDLMERDLSKAAPQTIPAMTIPVVSQISAGEPLYSEENIIEYSYAPSNIIKDNADYFYLKVTGDSMNKQFSEGDLLLIEKDAPIENGQIGIVQFNGYEATVKRVRYDENKVYLIPESTNPDHLPRVYNANDDVHFIGRVIMASSTKLF